MEFDEQNSTPRQSLEAAFLEAVGLVPAAREKFVERLAHEDPQLAARLTTLLSADSSSDAEDAAGFDALSRVRSVAGLSDAGILSGRTIGGFAIAELVGQGGSGAIYRARQARPAREVAFKSLRPELAGLKIRRRFELEAEHMAVLSHRNIATVIAAGFDEEARVAWLATEFIANAASIVEYARAQQLTREARVELMRTVCLAVAHAHSRGILHRDLKPSNILVGADGCVKVIDFGLARAVGGDDGRSLATETGELIGTLVYMSPEQCAGDPRAVDVRADVFALGAVLFELLADRPPRELSGVSVHGAILAVVDREIPPLSSIVPDAPRDLAAIVAMSCARERDARYATAADLAADLQRFLNHEPVLARPPGRMRKVLAWVRREPALAGSLALAVCALLGVAIGGVLYAKQQREENERAREITQRVSEQLVPAVKKLGSTTDAPSVREIERCSYELSVLVNGESNAATASLALRLAFEWMKGTGRDFVQAEHWAKIAEETSTRASGPQHTTALEARCVQAWAMLEQADEEKKTEARRRITELVEIIEQRDDVDTSSDCLLVLAEHAEAKEHTEIAARYYERAVARSTRINGAEASLTMQTRSAVVDSNARAKNWTAVLGELDDLLRIQRANNRSTDPWTIRFARQHGEALLRLGRAKDAELELIEVDNLVRQWLGEKHKSRNSVRALLREAITTQGRSEEAARNWPDVVVQ